MKVRVSASGIADRDACVLKRALADPERGWPQTEGGAPFATYSHGNLRSLLEGCDVGSDQGLAFGLCGFKIGIVVDEKRFGDHVGACDVLDLAATPVFFVNGLDARVSQAKSRYQFLLEDFREVFAPFRIFVIQDRGVGCLLVEGVAVKRKDVVGVLLVDVVRERVLIFSV